MRFHLRLRPATMQNGASPPMPTFLRLTCSFHRRAFVVSLLFCALVSSMKAQAGSSRHNSPSSMTAPAVSLPRPHRKRLVTFRRNETPEGPRFTLTSDSPLDDYRSFAEGERICVMIPQSAFISARRDESGRGFADMRVEQRETDVILSFRIQQDATVAINQNFNRLEIIFITNEQANSAG
jgi:hypothetical protein